MRAMLRKAALVLLIVNFWGMQEKFQVMSASVDARENSEILVGEDNMGLPTLNDMQSLTVEEFDMEFSKDSESLHEY
eukprot:CAMPEP_0113725346 /NCGR_PEP_ID=MMETSP0038_2-20120614/39679_1 /TAXON_ID=2898 /ORGANISM="Cryptomonas paramecium" /LENGTH=76 /DNA_ID=CAMNT_0000655539 /DNA_START=63 /DNA_END=290 /DNA_ORIENTATION=- /assembly_acc=CAM_ASM_000170